MPSKAVALFAAACLILAAVVGGTAWWLARTPAAPAEPQGGGPATQPVVTYGQADIGGPFQLVDQTGRTVDQSILEGRWTAVFFGFTYCPDYCPTTLQTLAAVKDQLGDRADDLQIVFITVDPERDTPEAMADYLQTASFPQGVIGLTGTEAQIQQAARAYRATYARREQPGGGYTMDHSLTVYLMKPDGTFGIPLHYGLGPERTASLIRREMER